MNRARFVGMGAADGPWAETGRARKNGAGSSFQGEAENSLRLRPHPRSRTLVGRKKRQGFDQFDRRGFRSPISPPPSLVGRPCLARAVAPARTVEGTVK